ncbi:MAG: DUF479 domain-containing protein [Flavobacterium sp.]|nr:DUF479 domain-containing protein [Flavobacterium sp.]
MNFLAHIYLSGDDPMVKIGNFMADGIRGRDFEMYPKGIQKGIFLHRAIDTFTDVHPLFRQGTKRLHEKYHHYAGVIVDVFYDHFLAANWARYSDVTLMDFSQEFYKILEDHDELLSDKTRHMLPIMKRENWLFSYATPSGIESILKQMDYRTKHRSKMGEAKTELLHFYDEFQEEFTDFFEEIQSMSKLHLLAAK